MGVFDVPRQRHGTAALPVPLTRHNIPCLAVPGVLALRVFARLAIVPSR